MTWLAWIVTSEPWNFSGYFSTKKWQNFFDPPIWDSKGISTNSFFTEGWKVITPLYGTVNVVPYVLLLQNVCLIVSYHTSKHIESSTALQLLAAIVLHKDRKSNKKTPQCLSSYNVSQKPAPNLKFLQQSLYCEVQGASAGLLPLQNYIYSSKCTD
jgi:hypothetical protein